MACFGCMEGRILMDIGSGIASNLAYQLYLSSLQMLHSLHMLSDTSMLLIVALLGHYLPQRTVEGTSPQALFSTLVRKVGRYALNL
jgi:hypothetical protein